jgi:hypothetical protein
MQAAIEIGAHSGGEAVKMVFSRPSSLDMMRIPSSDVPPLVNCRGERQRRSTPRASGYPR